MPISAVDAISPAFQHTWQQLTKPFRLGQWAKLAIVGLLAGELGSGGGCNFPHSFSNFPRPDSRHFLRQGFLSPDFPSIPSFPAIDPAIVGGLIVALVVAALVLGILFMYLSSVMRFVLFDSVLFRECRVGESWSRRHAPALRLFLWKLLYAFATFAGIVLLIGISAALAYTAGWFSNPGDHVLPLVLFGILVFFLVLSFALITAVIFVLIKDFVVPQMALENIGLLQAWHRLWDMMMADKGGYALYILMKIVLAIGAALMVGIATLILGLLIAIPTVGLSIIAVITGQTAGLTWNVYTITVAVVVGSILLAVFLYLVSLISVPVIVFFPAYSIYFFASRYPALNAILYPAPPQSLLAAQAGYPTEPPFLPPAPEPIG